MEMDSRNAHNLLYIKNTARNFHGDDYKNNA